MLEYVDAGTVPRRARSRPAVARARAAVAHFLYDGYWLDIGRHDDYEKAISEYEELKDKLWPEADPAPQVEPAERLT